MHPKSATRRPPIHPPAFPTTLFKHARYPRGAQESGKGAAGVWIGGVDRILRGGHGGPSGITAVSAAGATGSEGSFRFLFFTMSSAVVMSSEARLLYPWYFAMAADSFSSENETLPLPPLPPPPPQHP
eukprot:2059799-Pyramimonas_sp.AAC.1